LRPSAVEEGKLPSSSAAIKGRQMSRPLEHHLTLVRCPIDPRKNWSSKTGAPAGVLTGIPLKNINSLKILTYNREI